MKDREWRGGSEPPVNVASSGAVHVLPANGDLGFHDRSGLRKSQTPIRIAGINMRSQDHLDRAGIGGDEDPAWTNWRSSVTPNRQLCDEQSLERGQIRRTPSVPQLARQPQCQQVRAPDPTSTTPFGANADNHRMVVCPRMHFPKKNKKCSSVSNIVAALESEITTWKRNNTAPRDYSMNMGWSKKTMAARQSCAEYQLQAPPQRKTSEPIKFEPRRDPKLKRFFTFGGDDENKENVNGGIPCNGNATHESNGHGREVEASSVIGVSEFCSINASRRERRRNLSEVNGGKIAHTAASNPVAYGHIGNDVASTLESQSEAGHETQSETCVTQMSNEQTISRSEIIKEELSTATCQPSHLSTLSTFISESTMTEKSSLTNEQVMTSYSDTKKGEMETSCKQTYCSNESSTVSVSSSQSKTTIGQASTASEILKEVNYSDTTSQLYVCSEESKAETIGVPNSCLSSEIMQQEANSTDETKLQTAFEDKAGSHEVAEPSQALQDEIQSSSNQEGRSQNACVSSDRNSQLYSTITSKVESKEDATGHDEIVNFVGVESTDLNTAVEDGTNDMAPVDRLRRPAEFLGTSVSIGQSYRTLDISSASQDVSSSKKSFEKTLAMEDDRVDVKRLLNHESLATERNAFSSADSEHFEENFISRKVESMTRKEETSTSSIFYTEVDETQSTFYEQQQNSIEESHVRRQEQTVVQETCDGKENKEESFNSITQDLEASAKVNVKPKDLYIEELEVRLRSAKPIATECQEEIKVSEASEREEDDIIEVDPENVKIHESVVPTFSAQRNPTVTLGNTMEDEAKIKEDLFSSLLKVSRDSRARSLSTEKQYSNIVESTAEEDNGNLKLGLPADRQNDLVVSKAENLAFEDLFEQLVASECKEGELDMPPKLEEVTTMSHQQRLDKLQQKRQRHLTIDYHDLSPKSWNGTVSKCVQKTYGSDGCEDKESVITLDDAESEDGLGQGLGIILDKLKNIENKLDEIKELEEQNICINAAGHVDESGKVLARLPELGMTPSSNMSESSLHVLTHLTSDADQEASGVQNEGGFLVDRGINTSVDGAESASVASSNDDVTLDAGPRPSTNANEDADETDSNADTLTAPVPDDHDEVFVTSPVVTAGGVTETNDVEIKSVQSLSEPEDDFEEDRRQRRIENLAQQIIDEKKKLEKLEEEEKRRYVMPNPKLMVVDEGTYKDLPPSSHYPPKS